MSTDKGYIKLYRDIRDHWLWQVNPERPEPFDIRSAWIDLLMSANHEARQWKYDNKIMTVERGQTHTSLKILSVRWGWSVHKVSDYLNLLQKQGMITQSRNGEGTTITIDNYCIYQDSQGIERNGSGTGKERSRNGKGTHSERTRNDEGNKQESINTIEDTIEGTKEENIPVGTDPDEEGWTDNEGWGFD